MALIIEDGTGKVDSQSYATVAEARSYATARGVTLPVGDPAVEAMLLQGADYLESFRSQYQGHKTFPGGPDYPTHPEPQAMQWPRTDVVIDCSYDLPVSGPGSIPIELKRAQMQLCIEQQNGFSLLPSTTGKVVKKTKVDVIEKEFFSATDLGISGEPMPNFPAVDALLAPLFTACGTGAFLTTVRV